MGGGAGQVMEGDRVLQVDGQDVEAFDLATVKQLTVDLEGSVCILTLERDGQMWQAEMTRTCPREAFRPSKAPQMQAMAAMAHAQPHSASMNSAGSFAW